MENLRQSLNRLGLFFRGLAPWQRWSLVGAAVLVGAALLLVVLWSGRTTYEPLFANLDVDDQAAIVATLREQKIPYRLDPAANAILLPREQVYETRLSLAQEGLPKGGGVGYELFDQAKMGMSDFQQRVTWLRALEGELGRTIQQLDSVEFARVSIVIPQDQLFLEQQEPSTASVLLRLASGKKLGPEQVKAVVHLVARSVEGLQPDNVTVVDTGGAVLSDMLGDENILYGTGPGGQGVSSVQRELERQQEMEFERKVRQMLERVFGPGKAVVRVRVELDFDKRRSAQKEFIPGDTGKGVVRSQQNMEENYKGPGGVPGAPPGTTTNIPGYVVSAQGQGNSEYNKGETVTNYDITTRESEQVDGLKDAVAAAIGLDTQRGDRLVIQPMQFSTSFVDGMLAQLQAEQRQQLLLTLLALALLLLALALFGVWWMRRRKRLAKMAQQMEGEKMPSLKEIMEHPELVGGQSEVVVLEEQLRIYAMKNPEDVAAVLKNWLSED